MNSLSHNGGDGQITGAFLCAKAAAQQMIKTKSEGSIILIASMSAYIANRDLNCVAYNASKAGVLQMAKNLACEWAKYNIRVNVRFCQRPYDVDDFAWV